jgi:hypothetical protein
LSRPCALNSPQFTVRSGGYGYAKRDLASNPLCTGAISRVARKSRRSELAKFPATVDGFNGMALIEAAGESSKADGKRMKPAKI